MLGISRSTIYEMISKGQLEARKIGAATVVTHSALVALLERAPLTEPAQRALDDATRLTSGAREGR